MRFLSAASLGAVLRHTLRLLLDRATNDELGEFGEAILNRWTARSATPLAERLTRRDRLLGSAILS